MLIRSWRTLPVVMAAFVLPLIGLPAASSEDLVSAGDILVVDVDCCGTSTGGVIRVDPQSGEQTVLAAGAPLFNPTGVTVAPDGALLVADRGCCKGRTGGIIEIDPATGQQNVLSDGGVFFDPVGVAVDAAGRILVADLFCCGKRGGVIAVDPITGTQTLLSVGGSFAEPSDVAVDADQSILVADRACCGGGGGLFRVDPDTGEQTLLTSGGVLVEPTGVVLHPNGTVVLVDPHCCSPRPAHRGGLVAVDPDTGEQTVLAAGPPTLGDPIRGGIDVNGRVLVADAKCCPSPTGGVAVLDLATGATWTAAGGGYFAKPHGLDVVSVGVAGLTIDAVQLEGRDVRVSGTVTCGPLERWSLDVEAFQAATQTHGMGDDAGGCDGTPVPWATKLTRDGPGFRRTTATVCVDASTLLVGELRDEGSTCRTLRLG